MPETINITKAVTDGQRCFNLGDATENDLVGWALLRGVSSMDLGKTWPELFGHGAPKKDAIVQVSLTIDGVEIPFVDTLKILCSELADEAKRLASNMIAEQKNNAIDRIEEATRAFEAKLIGHIKGDVKQAWKLILGKLTDEASDGGQECPFCQAHCRKNDDPAIVMVHGPACPIPILYCRLFELVYED